MKSRYKIICGIFVAIIAVFVGKYFFQRHLLQVEYVKALEQKEDEYINSFYRLSFSGVITYIKDYDEIPHKYVVGIADSVKNEKAIGKVEITNFSNVMEGDTVRKKSNSFELEISGKKGKVLSLIKYE